MSYIKIILCRSLVLCTFVSSLSKAQNGYIIEYGLATGVSNYLGEIGGKGKSARPFIVDLKLAKSRWNETLYFRYKFRPQLQARMALNYLRIEGDDKLSSNIGRRYRNLSFRNDIFDIETTLHWLFYTSSNPSGIYRRSNTYLSAYLFTGVGFYRHNPKTLYQGSYIPLQPIKTEGVSYKRTGFCVPVGLGMYVSISRSRKKMHRIGLEVNWRYTTTDYLDDISTIYLNPKDLDSPTAVALSNRNPELVNQPPGVSKNYGWHDTDENGNPKNRAPRGNPNNKDSYISINISYGTVIKPRYTRSKGQKIRSVKF